jgi:hypothetical protein
MVKGSNDEEKEPSMPPLTDNAPMVPAPPGSWRPVGVPAPPAAWAVRAP